VVVGFGKGTFLFVVAADFGREIVNPSESRDGLDKMIVVYMVDILGLMVDIARDNMDFVVETIANPHYEVVV
jgi:hypothetical protein